MGSNGDGGPSAIWPAVSGTSYGADSEEDDSSKDGSLKESGNGDDMGNGTAGSDAEGVWSPDIEQSFQEALAIYPPCGRRKIILSDEGKMYGRNELIARYIKVRTGKTRTRKQVSSHIQVLARRKAREVSAKLKDHAAKEKALQSLTPAQISSLHNIQNKSGGGMGHPSAHSALHHSHHPGHQMNHTSHVATAAAGLAALGIAPPPSVTPHFNWQPALSRDPQSDVKPPTNVPLNANNSNHANNHNNNNNNNNIDWEGRSIASHKLRLIEFTSFLDSGPDTDRHLFVQIGGVNAYTDPLLEDIDLRQISDKFPTSKGGLKDLYDKGPQDAFFLVKFWADLNIPNSLIDDLRSFYGVASHFESVDRMSLCLSTKVCSFGKEAVEKVETIDCPTYVNGRYVYRLDRSEMCVYMVNFIHKLKDLPEKYMMNSVLENFTILQVISNRDTNETLLCIAFVFEVSISDNGAQHHIYRLVKPNDSH